MDVSVHQVKRRNPLSIALAEALLQVVGVRSGRHYGEIRSCMKRFMVASGQIL